MEKERGERGTRRLSLTQRRAAGRRSGRELRCGRKVRHLRVLVASRASSLGEPTQAE